MAIGSRDELHLMATLILSDPGPMASIVQPGEVVIGKVAKIPIAEKT